MLVARFPVLLGVVAGILVAVCGAFVFSLPMLRAPVDETMLSSPKHVGVERVRRTFRDYGVRLRYASHPSAELTVLGATLPPWPESGLYVAVPASGDVVVHYGGSNAAVRSRLRAAAAALSR